LQSGTIKPESKAAAFDSGFFCCGVADPEENSESHSSESEAEEEEPMRALLRLWMIAAVLWGVMAANTAGAVVINFDDLEPVIGVPGTIYPNGEFLNPGIGDLPASYAGFNWSQFGATHKDFYAYLGFPGTGYEYGTVSGSYAAFNVWAAVATVDGRPFVLRSAYLTAAEYESLQVTVTGYRAGQVVFSSNIGTTMTAPVMFEFPPSKVDTVTFAPGVGDGVFVMDDFAYATIPVVDAGENIVVSSENQDTVIIHGTATDEDGELLVYRWLQGETALTDWQDVGPNGEAYLDLGPAASLPAGDYTLTLQVKPVSIEIVETDEMILTISNSSPQPIAVGEGTYDVAALIILGGEVSDYDGDLITYEWLEGSSLLFQGSAASAYGGDSVDLPNHVISDLEVGAHTLTLRVSDGINEPVSKEIVVNVIDHLAPTLAPKADKKILWPPFHQMVPVTIVANAVDNSGEPVTLTATVTSDEPRRRRECYEPEDDWTTPVIDQETGVITLKLRAEKNPRGKGRTYTITITATDQAGNSSRASVKITVPHSYRGDCDHWWKFWHNYHRNRWNDHDYKDWFDGWFTDWMRSWHE
jgi:hypothetical protein